MSKGFDQIKMSKAYSRQSASTEKFKIQKRNMLEGGFSVVYFFPFPKNDCIPT